MWEQKYIYAQKETCLGMCNFYTHGYQHTCKHMFISDPNTTDTYTTVTIHMHIYLKVYSIYISRQETPNSAREWEDNV